MLGKQYLLNRHKRFFEKIVFYGSPINIIMAKPDQLVETIKTQSKKIA